LASLIAIIADFFSNNHSLLVLKSSWKLGSTWWS